MRKIILLLFLLIGGVIYGQPLRNPYQHHLDSLAMSNLSSRLAIMINPPDKMATFQPSKYVKFTFKTYVQTDLLVNLIDGDMTMNDVDIEDIAAIGKYDIRMKIYLSRDVRFVSRMVATGISTQNYSYSCGFILKF